MLGSNWNKNTLSKLLAQHPLPAIFGALFLETGCPTRRVNLKPHADRFNLWAQAP